ncbi:TetR family transcriptional regulator [Actinokineospora sp. PR83]|uniref:TetR/AcrR family transcriptional regulator n=1 Tax=Actinokineospora sp. PR83 TaxID=2884908 RepID=UPI001F3264CF|nr:TetR/AcrR family transcriptional regulator [Actinokineospora sp. PR83]MCG8917708.1 TetR family transcriptional regulator [Actinokineospora sp. PR83]
MTPTPAERGPSGARDANRARIRTRLLDSAEELFADRGYFGVSVRDITDHAGTRVAAISEQFGGKEKLFRHVLLRRIQPINDDRRALLAALPRTGPRARLLRAFIHAFTQPMLIRAGESRRWHHYFRFIAQLANSGQSVQLLVADEYNSIATEFIERLQQIFPDVSDTAAHDAYLLMLASTLQVFSDNLRLDSITGGRMRTGDIEQRYASLVAFLEGGITSLLRTRPPSPQTM